MLLERMTSMLPVAITTSTMSVAQQRVASAVEAAVQMAMQHRMSDVCRTRKRHNM